MPFAPSFVNGFVQISVVLTTTPAYVIDGARFYQQPRSEYSISQEISSAGRVVCCPAAGQRALQRRKGVYTG